MSAGIDPQPDDLAPGVYIDQDSDLWLVDVTGTAHALTDRLGYEHGLSDLIIRDGASLPADEAHAAYTLRMIRGL
ncbi:MULTISPECIES: hypothetical protein [Bacteria]|uniref:hypothetical protein n=1 Tax=Bacteria TaxID=2 RepID=UPI003C7BD4F6